jgi:hypothetical protein
LLLRLLLPAANAAANVMQPLLPLLLTQPQLQQVQLCLLLQKFNMPITHLHCIGILTTSLLPLHFSCCIHAMLLLLLLLLRCVC